MIFRITCLLFLVSISLLGGEEPQTLSGKKTIAIGNFNWNVPTKIGAGHAKSTLIQDKDGAEAVVKSMLDMMVTALIQTRKFEVLEREQLKQIAQELSFIHDSGMVDLSPENLEKIPEWGMMHGVSYLVLGSVSRFSSSEEGLKLGLLKKFGGSTGKQTLAMTVDMRVVDVETGTILSAIPVTREVHLGTQFGMANTHDGGGFGVQKDVAEQINELLRSMATQLVHNVVKDTIPIQVIKKTDHQVKLSYGKGLLQEGDTLEIFRQGEVFVDPDTHEREAELISLGYIQVVQTQRLFSNAVALGDLKFSGVSIHDICVLADAPKMKGKQKKKKEGKKFMGLFGKDK